MLILASTSEFRKALLAKVTDDFTTFSPNVDETPLADETPTELVTRLSEAKARAAIGSFSQGFVIGSDQVALFEGDILGKPHTTENAIAQLTRFSGHKVTFLTGLCVFDLNTQKATTVCVPFYVHFRQLTQAEIARYVEKEQPLKCAGSFKSEGLGITLFEKLEGDDPNTLIGLPLITLNKLLLEKGYALL